MSKATPMFNTGGSDCLGRWDWLEWAVGTHQHHGCDFLGTSGSGFRSLVLRIPYLIVFWCLR